MEWLPANWQDTPGIRLTEAVSVINDGIPLIWVPRAAIVADLVSAPGAAARAEILVAASAEISDDCSDALAKITRPELKPLAALAARSARALRADLPEPAQALAASVVDTCLREMASRGTILRPVSNKGWHRRVRKQIEPVGAPLEAGPLVCCRARRGGRWAARFRRLPYASWHD